MSSLRISKSQKVNEYEILNFIGNSIHFGGRRLRYSIGKALNMGDEDVANCLEEREYPLK